MHYPLSHNPIFYVPSRHSLFNVAFVSEMPDLHPHGQLNSTWRRRRKAEFKWAVEWNASWSMNRPQWVRWAVVNVSVKTKPCVTTPHFKDKIHTQGYLTTRDWRYACLQTHSLAFHTRLNSSIQLDHKQNMLEERTRTWNQAERDRHVETEMKWER